MAEVQQYGDACPSQWMGTTVDGRSFYARYRWGRLSVEVDDIEIFVAQIGDPLHGVLDEARLRQELADLVIWPAEGS